MKSEEVDREKKQCWDHSEIYNILPIQEVGGAGHGKGTSVQGSRRSATPVCSSAGSGRHSMRAVQFGKRIKSGRGCKAKPLTARKREFPVFVRSEEMVASSPSAKSRRMDRGNSRGSSETGMNTCPRETVVFLLYIHTLMNVKCRKWCAMHRMNCRSFYFRLGILPDVIIEGGIFDAVVCVKRERGRYALTAVCPTPGIDFYVLMI